MRYRLVNYLEIFGPWHVGFTGAEAYDSIFPAAKDGRIQKHFKLEDEIALLRGFGHLQKLRATSHFPNVVWAQSYGDAITILGTHLETAYSAWETVNDHLFTLRLLCLGNESVEATPFRRQRKLAIANISMSQ